MNKTKDRASPSGLGGSHPLSLFVEEEKVDLTPQESRVREPRDSISIQTPETVTVSGSPQFTSTANSGQKKNPLILSALPSGGMKSPCTSANQLYQNRETKQEHEEWLEAIARDDLREGR